MFRRLVAAKKKSAKRKIIYARNIIIPKKIHKDFLGLRKLQISECELLKTVHVVWLDLRKKNDLRLEITILF